MRSNDDVLLRMTKTCQSRIAALPLLAALGVALSGCSDLAPHFAARYPQHAPGVDSAIISRQIAQRFLLIGDAGEDRMDEPVLRLIKERAAKEVPERTTLIFLGDNIYETGMPEDGCPKSPARKTAEERLQAQIQAAKDSHTRAVFVPGNHDWKAGLAGLRRERDYLRKAMPGRGEFLPEPGEPGPVVKDFPRVRLIALDTELLLKPELMPNKSINLKAVMTKLAELVATAQGRKVMVIAHHPPLSHGAHGGFLG